MQTIIPKNTGNENHNASHVLFSFEKNENHGSKSDDDEFFFRFKSLDFTSVVRHAVSVTTC
jgi:hypothetical protein